MQPTIKHVLARKGIHLLVFVVPLSYYFFLSRLQFVAIMGCLTTAACLVEFLRFRSPRFSHLFQRVVGNMLWDHEQKTLTGATTFAIAASVCAAYFSKPVVVTALLFVTFSDTISYFIGRIGRIRLVGRKTVEGALGFMTVSMVIVLMIPEIRLFPGFIAALAACAVEALPWQIDDNLSIPLITCPILQLLMQISFF
jgi:dolichol kinase